VTERFSALRKEWRRLIDAAPGRRFIERFRRRHTKGARRGIKRALYIAGGSVVFAVGVVVRAIPFLPGGSALIALGAALVSKESKTAASWLDRSELALRGAWRRLIGRLTGRREMDATKAIRPNQGQRDESPHA
jgi:hypothetical protein